MGYFWARGGASAKARTRSAARGGRDGLILACGLAIFWLWPWMLSEELARMSAATASMTVASLWLRTCFFAFLGTALVLLAVLYRMRRIRVPRAWAPGATVACLGAASVLLLVGARGNAVIEASCHSFDAVLMATVCSLLGGVGIALLCVECGTVAGVVGSRKTLLSAIAATLCGAILCQGLRMFTPTVSHVVLVALSFACGPLMRLLGQQEVDASPGSLPETGAQRVRVPWKLTITTVMWTATYGMVSAVFDGGGVWEAHCLLAYILGAVALFAFLLRSHLNFNDLIYKVGFMVAAAGIAVLLFAQALVPIGYFLFMVGCRFVELLIWGLFAHLTGTRGLPAYWTTALNVGIWTLGRLGGFWVATLVFDVPGGAFGEGAHTVILMAELVILVGALFLSSQSNYAEGWGMERVANGNLSERQIEYCCRVLGAEHRLTQRESEVLELLAKGATRAEIGEHLCISSETAKTHIRHVYQKIGANAHEDVRGIINAMVSAAWEC